MHPSIELLQRGLLVFENERGQPGPNSLLDFVPRGHQSRPLYPYLVPRATDIQSLPRWSV